MNLNLSPSRYIHYAEAQWGHLVLMAAVVAGVVWWVVNASPTARARLAEIWGRVPYGRPLAIGAASFALTWYALVAPGSLLLLGTAAAAVLVPPVRREVWPWVECAGVGIRKLAGHSKKSLGVLKFGLVGLALLVVKVVVLVYVANLVLRFLVGWLPAFVRLEAGCLVVFAALALLGGARPGGRKVKGDEWWRLDVLMAGMLAAGIVPKPTGKNVLQLPQFRSAGKVSDDDYGTSIVIVLPGARVPADAVEKSDRLAAALGLHPDRFTVEAVVGGKTPNGIRLTYAAPRVAPSAAPVAAAAATRWADPVVMGKDARGRSATFRTVGRHSMFVGCTNSGKTWAARLVVAHALLDPTTTVYGIIGKDDHSDWRPMRPLCAGYVPGVGRAELPKVAALLAELDEISERRGASGDTDSAIVVVVEEWFRIRSALGRLGDRSLKDVDAQMAELLATGRSRNIHVIMCVQRGVKEYVTTDQRANLLQRFVGQTTDPAEVQYVIGQVPSQLPRSSGEFLVSDDDGAPVLVQVDPLNDDQWKRLCWAASLARPLRDSDPSPHTGAAVSEPPAPAQPVGNQPTDAETVPPSPMLDPLLDAVLDVLADADPAGITATVLHAELPEWVRPPAAAALGRQLPKLARESGLIRQAWVAKDKVWRLTNGGKATLSERSHPPVSPGTSSGNPRTSSGEPPVSSGASPGIPRSGGSGGSAHAQTGGIGVHPPVSPGTSSASRNGSHPQ